MIGKSLKIVNHRERKKSAYIQWVNNHGNMVVVKRANGICAK